MGAVRHSEAELERAARRLEELADRMDPATAGHRLSMIDRGKTSLSEPVGGPAPLADRRRDPREAPSP